MDDNTSGQVNNPIDVVGPQQPAPPPVASASSQQDAGAATAAPDVNNPAPAAVGGPANAATPPPPQGNAPGAQIPKQSFMEGANAVARPSYRTDANGTVLSNQPVRAPSVKGVLGSILMGALEGAARGATAQAPERSRGKGAAFSAGAAAAQKGRIEADDRARAIAQRNFENNQAATAEKVKANLMVAQTHDLVQKSQLELEDHAADLHTRGITDEEHQLAVQNGLDQRREVHANLIQALLSHHVQPYATISQTPDADGKTMDAQAMAHVKPLVGGQAIPVQNGKVGEKNGAELFSNKDLDRPVDGNPNDPSTWIQVPTYDGIKDNAGKFVPHNTAIKPDGKTTYGDVARQFMAADAQLQKFMGLDAQTMSKKYQQAEIDAKEAEAGKYKSEGALAQTQAEQIQKLGAPIPQGFQLNPQVFAMPQADLQKDLQQKGVQLPADFASLYDVAHYDGDLKTTFPVRTQTKSGQRDANSAKTFIRTYINPTFDDTVFPTIQKTKTAFIDGKEGQSIRSFNQFLVHSSDVSDISSQFQRTGSPWLNKPINAVKSGGLGDSNVVRLMTGIEAARQEWQTFIDSGYKPDAEQSARAEILMSDKSTPSQIHDVLTVMGDQAIGRLDQLNEAYKTATGKNYPNLVTPSGLAAAEKLGLAPKLTQYQSGGNFVQNQNPQQPPPQAQKAFTLTNGQNVTPDAAGNFVQNGWIYHARPDGSGADLVKKAPPAPAQ